MHSLRRSVACLAMQNYANVSALPGAIANVFALRVVASLVAMLLTMGFWMQVLALFLGFAVVIAVMFFIKSLFVGRGVGRRRHAH